MLGLGHSPARGLHQRGIGGQATATGQERERLLHQRPREAPGGRVSRRAGPGARGATGRGRDREGLPSSWPGRHPKDLGAPLAPRRRLRRRWRTARSPAPRRPPGGRRLRPARWGPAAGSARSTAPRDGRTGCGWAAPCSFAAPPRSPPTGGRWALPVPPARWPPRAPPAPPSTSGWFSGRSPTLTVTAVSTTQPSMWTPRSSLARSPAAKARSSSGPGQSWAATSLREHWVGKASAPPRRRISSSTAAHTSRTRAPATMRPAPPSRAAEAMRPASRRAWSASPGKAREIASAVFLHDARPSRRPARRRGPRAAGRCPAPLWPPPP